MAKKAATATAVPEVITLEVLSKQIQETSKGVVNGNTVIFSHGYDENATPTVVGFSVIRGEEGDEDYNGNAVITGSVQGGVMETRNLDFQTSDGACYKPIFDTCKGIITPPVPEEAEPTQGVQSDG